LVNIKINILRCTVRKISKLNTMLLQCTVSLSEGALYVVLYRDLRYKVLNVPGTVLQEMVQIVILFEKKEHFFYIKLLLRMLIRDEM